MTFHSIRLAAAGLAWCAAGAGFAQTTPKLPLAEELVPQLKPVLESALKQSPRILAGDLDVVQAQANRRMAESHQRPNVSANGHYLYGYESRADLAAEKWRATGKLDYNVNVLQPVYHWGVLAAGSEIGRIDEEIAHRSYVEGQRALALEIRAGYLQLILAKLNVRNNAFNEQLARTNLDRQEIRFKAGQITMGEILNHRLHYDEAALATRRASADLDFALRSFRRLSGQTAFAAADIPAAVPEPAPPPDLAPAAASSAYLESTELQRSALEIRKATLDYQAAKNSVRPNVDFVAGLSQDEVSYTADITARYRVQFVYAGFQVNWTIFDSGMTAGRKLATLTRRRQLERTRAELLETLPERVERAALEIALAWDNYRNVAMHYRFAREFLDFTRQNLARGEASQDQVDSAQSGAYGAEYPAQSALVSYLNAAATYLSAMRADPAANSVVNP